MAKYRLIEGQGSHSYTDETGQLVTVQEGETFESDKDICAAFNKDGQPPRFELVA